MSENQFTLPRGMKDIEPDEIARRIWLTGKDLVLALIDRRTDIVHHKLNPETFQSQ